MLDLRISFLHNIKQLKNVPSIKNNKIRMDEYDYYFKEKIIIPTLIPTFMNPKHNHFTQKLVSLQ